jgi:predicted nucleotidyltransferase
MTHPHLSAILARIKAELERRYGERLAEVRLFGSQARGEATEESDIDLLVVLYGNLIDISKEQDQFFDFKYELELEFDTLIQIIFTTPERLYNSHAPLYVGVRKESLVL